MIASASGWTLGQRRVAAIDRSPTWPPEPTGCELRGGGFATTHFGVHSAIALSNAMRFP